ncbi:hypothetical protein LXL04_025833 [Taraxacum kok-saghyz]
MCKTHPVLALLPSTSQRRLPLHLRHPLQRPLPLSGDVLSSAGERSQQQNIADAIDLLPRLTTGIDVNITSQELKTMQVYLKFTKNLNLLLMSNNLDAAKKPIFAKHVNGELKTIEVHYFYIYSFGF